MNTAKIEITNWPQKNIFDYLVLTISIISLICSLYSLYISRSTLISSSRPFVSARSFAIINPQNNTITQAPLIVDFCVTNAPAKVLNYSIKILNGERNIYEYKDSDLVCFPTTENAPWHFNITEQDFKNVIGNCDPKNLHRLVNIEYKALDGSKTYKYELMQRFEPEDNQWRNIKVSSN